MSQKLRGFVGQKMAAAKSPFISYTALIPPSSTTWTCPRSGYYRFAQWGSGGGGVGSTGGASGSHAQKVVHLNKLQTVAIVVPDNGSSADCTVTLPDGRVVTAGSASGVTPGAASGGDINLAGSAGGTSGGNGAAGLGDNGGLGGIGNGSTDGGGAGAPGSGAYQGGTGCASSATPRGNTPGGGGSAVQPALRGSGMVIIQRQNGLIA